MIFHPIQHEAKSGTKSIQVTILALYVKLDFPIMFESLKPRFYVLRPNGFATPLIAVDELPQHIQVEGVPRVLTIEDIADNDMQHMPGKFEARHEIHKIVDKNKVAALSNGSSISGRPLDAAASPYIAGTHEAISVDRTQLPDNVFPGPKKYYGIQDMPPDGVVKTAPAPTKTQENEVPGAYGKHDPLPPWQQLPDDVRLPTKGRKVYCSHWMSTGECDYAQQGCLYKHEMPLDQKLLESLGFQDIPKWYREKYGIGKLTAVPGSGAHYRSSSQGSASPATSSPNWRQRNSKAVGGQPAPRTGQNRTISNRGMIASPRPIPARSAFAQSLLDLQSRPATPNGTVSNKGKGLLESKFAPLRPAASPITTPYGTLSSQSSAGPSSEAEDSVSSTVVETGKQSSLTSKKAGTSLPPAILKWQDFSAEESTYAVDVSRRSSFATDYETEAMQELENRKALEKKELAESEALAAREKEQLRLKQAQGHAFTQARKTLRDVHAEKKQLLMTKPDLSGSIRATAKTRTVAAAMKRTAEPVTPPDSAATVKVDGVNRAAADAKEAGIDYRKSQLQK